MEDKPKKLIATHGFQCDLKDGIAFDKVDRSVVVAMFDTGSYGVSIITNWPDSKDPMVTKFQLSRDGLRLLTEALVEATTNMHLHPMKEEK
jgi:hypothetical protein